jgi:hypothetical protein
VGIVAPSTPCTRLAICRHPSLEHDGSLVKLLTLNLCQLVPVNPILVVQFLWVVHPPAVRTLCILFPGRVIRDAAEVASMSVHTGFASASARVIGAIVDVSGDGGASRAVRVALPGGSWPGRDRIVGVSRF